MEKWKVKTRKNESPQGKPRVYFCSHPDDLERYLQPISDDILLYQNCAIWYTEDPRDKTADFLEDLKLMQLFVMPITSNLLRTENEALAVEFQFAIANHIPVLPLMQEDGLEDLFNKKCGDLHFLDKHNADPTAIGYDQKLQQYLQSVLIGDELAEKVRASFDAYIFLSYRKKDRKYAQQLMRFIHNHDSFECIAVWYDEFLSPGENFNNSIKSALQKSGLFLLTVTPNLVIEPNYIMTTEYPMARAAGLPILPVELVQTDLAQLFAKYEGIPDPADIQNETAFTKALMDSIPPNTVKENKLSYERNYLTGLAYLGGIDVEVDHEKALKLITLSAECDYIPALEKMVHLYGSSRRSQEDPSAVVKWQRKLIDCRKSLFLESRSAQDGHQLASDLGYLGYLYENQLKDPVSAEKAYRQMLAFGEEMEDHNAMISSHIYLGTLRRSAKDFSSAYAHYMQAKEIAEAHENIVSKWRISEIYSLMGETAKQEDAYPKAFDFYVQAYEIIKQIAQQTDSDHNKFQLCTICETLGGISEKCGNDANVYKYYGEKIEILKAMLADDGNARHKRSLIVLYTTVVYYAQSRNQWDVATRYLAEQMSLKRSLAEEKKDEGSVWGLILGYNELGDMAILNDDRDLAYDAYSQALELAQQRYDKSQSTSRKRDLAECCRRVADVLDAKKDSETAMRYYSQALELYKCVAKEVSRDWAKEILIDYCAYLGQVATHHKRFDDAYKTYCEALDMCKTLEQKEYRGFIQIYNLLYKLCEAMGDTALCQKYYDENVRLVKSIAQRKGDAGRNLALAMDCKQLARIAYGRKDLETSRQLYLWVADIHERFYADYHMNAYLEEVPDCYDCAGNVAQAQGDLDQAFEYYSTAQDVRIKIAREANRLELLEKVIQYYQELAQLAEKNGKMDAACSFYTKARTCMTQMAEKTNDAYWQRAISIVCDDLGRLLRKQGNTDEAHKHYMRSLEIRLKILDNTELAKDDLAISYYNIGYLLKSKDMLEKARHLWLELDGIAPHAYKRKLEIVSRIMEAFCP